MPTVSLQIKTKTPENKSSTTSITYVNPETDGQKLKEFTRKLNALTNNSYESTNRIEKINLENEEFTPGGGSTAPIKPTPTLSLAGNRIPTSAMTDNILEADITYDGDGELYCIVNNTTNGTDYWLTTIRRNDSGNGKHIVLLWESFETPAAEPQAETFKLCASEGTNYGAAEYDFEIYNDEEE